ncbi:TrmH family RNA methyltransferase [Flavobacterium cerinum]|uniref:TrmH family RNA methyltransferase n=1 Tax=Flavobacterium cerinum TaxID=2502784 RepID=A0ABY5IST3_9FLAO|nr:TrmH family RNA methyltransferase [Flavobacterium cerinum]UUC44434.1 TrmH family RNA methyltransferase [Flavobacterium cerinum]
MQEQLTHENTAFQQKTFPITVVCDSIYFQSNIGSIFRISEALGVEKIILTGDQLVFSPRKINKTSRSTHTMVPYEIIENAEDAVSYLKDNNYQIIVLEITDKSIPLKALQITPDSKIALVIGNEIYGVGSTFLNHANQTVHIELFGKNSSINVAQATGIALYELTNKL